MSHPFLNAIIFLLWACMAQQRKIDWDSLVLCRDKCRLPWQTCATCFVTNFHSPVGYCSDRTESGLCNYKDSQIYCQCDASETGIFYRPTVQIMGDCQRDSDCLQPMHRCATCLGTTYPNLPYRGISPQKLCSTSEKGPYQDACSSIWHKSCSCGQMLPETNEASAAAAAAFEQNPAFADPPLFGIPPPTTAGAEIGPEDAWN